MSGFGREITVGRNSNCDIYLNPQFIYASGNHAVIYNDGNQLLFRDTSTNGTVINGVNVKHYTVPIRHGDVILLAGKYPLGWDQIDSYFGGLSNNSATRHSATMVDPSGRTTNVTPANYNSGAGYPTGSSVSPSSQASTPNISKWNWGAFGWYPIWGLFNGCWWALLLSLILGWLWPIPNIFFGVYGSRWAWQNKEWTSVEAFNDAQSKWAIAGIIIFCLSLILTIISVATLIDSL